MGKLNCRSYAFVEKKLNFEKKKILQKLTDKSITKILNYLKEIHQIRQRQAFRKPVTRIAFHLLDECIIN
jgi:hypothetical protein